MMQDRGQFAGVMSLRKQERMRSSHKLKVGLGKRTQAIHSIGTVKKAECMDRVLVGRKCGGELIEVSFQSFVFSQCNKEES